MRVAIIGTGYVGLVSGACLAELGHDVVCVDTHTHKIKLLCAGVIPIYEPGLEKLVKQNMAAGRLRFSTSFADSIPDAEVVFIAVGTPSAVDGSVDLQYLEAAARMIGEQLTDDYVVIANKSTAPVGTTERIAHLVSERRAAVFDVVSNPEFLREGQAIADFLSPARIVVGSSSSRATEVMLRLYAPIDCPKLVMDQKSAELTKYASNVFLATKLSLINEMSHICEELGADIEAVAQGVGLDPRIGKDFLRAGIGWGGSCFPKDVLAMKKLGETLGHPMPIVNAALTMNQLTRHRVIDRLTQELDELVGKTIAVLGIAFKPHTDDTRESAAIEIMRLLRERGVSVRAYDPIAVVHPAHHGFEVVHAATPYAAAQDAHAIIIATEWDEFRALDLALLKRVMLGNVLMDARNLLQPELAQQHGFRYLRIGRKIE